MSQPATPEALARRFVTLPLSELQPNQGQIDGLPANPRTITADKLDRLKRDIEQYPELLELRGLLVYPYQGKYVIIGGNMRYAALTQLGHRQAPCVIIPAETSADRLRAYTILDNAPFGQWDWDALANEWDEAQLPEWGVDVWQNPTVTSAFAAPQQDATAQPVPVQSTASESGDSQPSPATAPAETQAPASDYDPGNETYGLNTGADIESSKQLIRIKVGGCVIFPSEEEQERMERSIKAYGDRFGVSFGYITYLLDIEDDYKRSQENKD